MGFSSTVQGQEDNLYAKKNYEKYLSALKNSGLVSVEEKAPGATAEVTVGAEGGAGAVVLMGRILSPVFFLFNLDCFMPTFATFYFIFSIKI